MNITRDQAKQCVGKGWSGLIDMIFDQLPEEANIFQIKEKFGTLRFYVDNVTDDVQEFIASIEAESHYICEDCGNPGKLRNTSWMRTLCDNCLEEWQKGR